MFQEGTEMSTRKVVVVARTILLAGTALCGFAVSSAMAVTGANTNDTGGNAGVTGSVAPGNDTQSGSSATGAGTGGGAAGNLAPGSAGGNPNASPALTPGTHPAVPGKAGNADQKKP